MSAEESKRVIKIENVLEMKLKVINKTGEETKGRENIYIYIYE